MFANPSTPNVEITDSGIVFSGTSGPALADNPVYANQAKHGDEAGESAAFCAAAKKPLDADPRLAAEVAAVFGKATFKATGEDCLYPLQVLRYASADVLVFQAGEPGGGCHGCGAPLSAYVVRRVNGGFQTVRRYRQFATLGTFGAVGDISAIEIGGDDGMAIESGGMFQGYAFTGVDFYAFHAGQLVSLNTTPIPIADDNSGAMTDPSKSIEVTAKWFFDSADKRALVVDYKIRAHDAARVERVVWRLQGRSLVLSRGRVPPEVSAAGGVAPPAETGRANAVPPLAVYGRTAAETDRATGAPLVVYGEAVKVAPCSHGIPDSTFTWNDIKDYLPPGILRAPKPPMSHEQIVAALGELSRNSGTLAGEDVQQFVPVYQAANKDDKNDPIMVLIDAFNSDHGGDALPGVDPGKIKAAEKHTKEALALGCLDYAVQGKEPQ